MEKNSLSPLGRKIFLDRYALKDVQKKTLNVGDLVVAVSNQKTGQREVGTLTRRNGNDVTVRLDDGSVIDVKLDDIDKPLEVRPEQMLDRVARGIASRRSRRRGRNGKKSIAGCWMTGSSSPAEGSSTVRAPIRILRISIAMSFRLRKTAEAVSSTALGR